MAILDTVKNAMMLVDDSCDDTISILIESACADLGIVGVTATSTTTDPILILAIITYCRLHFGSPSDYENLKRSYDEQKSQLISASGYGLPSEV